MLHINVRSAGQRQFAEYVIAISVSLLLCAGASGQQHSSDSADPLGRLPGEELVSAKEMSDLLEFWGDSLRGNNQRIRTWKGTYRYSEEQVDSGPMLSQKLAGLRVQGDQSNASVLTRRTSGTIRFSLDVVNDRLFTSNLADDSPSASIDGKESALPGQPRCFRLAILTPEDIVSFDPEMRYAPTALSEVLVSDGQMGRMAFKEARERSSAGGWGTVVDPREFSVCYRQWDQFMFLAKSIRSGEYKGVDGHSPQLFVSHQGRYPTYRYLGPVKYGDALSYDEYVVEMRDAPLVTAWRTRDAQGRITLETLRDFEMLDGIWIPVSVTRTVGDDAGKLKFRRTYQLQGGQLNEAIDPSAFTLAALGLMDGDRLLDKIRGIEYTWRDGDLHAATGDIRGEASEAMAAVQKDLKGASPSADVVRAANRNPAEQPASQAARIPPLHSKWLWSLVPACLLVVGTFWVLSRWSARRK